MPYLASRHFHSGYQHAQPRRGRGDSDATLVDYQPTRPPEPAYQNNHARAINPGYDHSRNPYREYRQSQRLKQNPFADPRHSGQSSNSNKARRASCLKQARRSYPGRVYDNAPSPRGRGAQQRRSVHFDDDIDSYGFNDGEDDYEDTYTPYASRHGRDISEKRYSDLPQPVTAPQHPAGGMPFGYLILPPKEKKATMFGRFKKYLIEITRNPDYVILGCRPGDPTPQDILDKEAEEDSIEEAKQAEIRQRREEAARQSKLHRQNAYNARRAERLAQEARLQSQHAKRDSDINSRLAAYNPPRSVDYDGVQNSKRTSMQPGK